MRIKGLVTKLQDAGGRVVGYVGDLTVRNPPRHRHCPLEAARDVDPVLGQQRADHVDQLGALLDQQIARAVERQCRLLLGRLDRDEAHRRSRHRLADRFCVVGVGLATLDVRLDVRRRHQAHLMA